MSERGSALPAVLVVVFGGFLVLGLALDLGRWAFVQREAVFAADAGAQAGAAILDQPAAYQGDVRVDPGPAQAVAVGAALEARPRPGRSATASATPAEVCVTVTQPFGATLLRAAGAGSPTVTGRACARPSQG